jgi:hypothetical protein
VIYLDDPENEAALVALMAALAEQRDERRDE